MFNNTPARNPDLQKELEKPPYTPTLADTSILSIGGMRANRPPSRATNFRTLLPPMAGRKPGTGGGVLIGGT